MSLGGFLTNLYNRDSGGNIIRPQRCQGCPFRTPTCGNKGPEDSPFVIIGESPGSSEIAKGMPFVGPSGTMLVDVLRGVGYDDSLPEPYVINALQCYPASAEKGEILPHATSACHNRVIDQLRAYPRKVILALGAAASWTTTGDYSIRVTRDRGKVLPSPYAECGVVLAVHPAYLMRNGAGLPFWKKDLKQAVDLFKGENIGDWQEPTWSVVDNRQKLEAVVDKYTAVRDEPELATGDVETDSLNPYTGRLLSLGITKGKGTHVDIIDEDTIYANWDLMRPLLESPYLRWNWHNGKFDIKWFWYALNKTLPRINARVDEDTMLLSYAMNSNPGFHDLDQVAQNWIHAPAHKHAVKQWLPNKRTSYRNIPSVHLYKYQAFDVSKTHQQFFPMWEALLEEDSQRSNKNAHGLEWLYRNLLIPASNMMARVEEQGVLLDIDKVRANYVLHNKELEAINTKLQVYAREHLGREINYASPVQLRELLYKAMRLGPKNCVWHKESTDEKHLILVQREHNHPIIHDLLNYREVAKRKGTYVTNHLPPAEKDTKAKQKDPPLYDPDGRVRPSFLIHGTGTGRLACRDPNILNFPRGPLVRGQYVASPGKVFVEIDLNQAELRSLALMSGDPLLVKIYTENTISIHDVTTSKFFGSKAQMKEDPSVMREAAHLLQYFGELTPDRVYKEAKMRGKAVNFGIVYGREAHSLAQEFNISHQEAQRWIDEWLEELYPQAGEFIKKCRASVLRQQTITTAFGRKKKFGVVSPEKLHDYQNEAANFPHQSTASDIMLLTAMEVEYPMRERWGAYMWNEVYDAIYVEVDADDQKINELITYVQGVITRVPRDHGLTRVPFLGDAKVGYDWGNMEDWAGTIEATVGLREVVDLNGVI